MEVRCDDCRWSIFNNQNDTPCSSYRKLLGLEHNHVCTEDTDKSKSYFEPVLKVGDRVWVTEPYDKTIEPKWMSAMDKYKNTGPYIIEFINAYGYLYLRNNDIDYIFHPAWLTSNEPKQKKEKELMYEIIEPFSAIDIAKKSPCTEEYAKLISWLGANVLPINYMFQTWEDCKMAQVLVDNTEWLIDKGFIKKVKREFKPFTLNLKIESQEEFDSLLSRLNNNSLTGEIDTCYHRPVTITMVGDLYAQVRKAWYEHEEETV